MNVAAVSACEQKLVSAYYLKSVSATTLVVKSGQGRQAKAWEATKTPVAYYYACQYYNTTRNGYNTGLNSSATHESGVTLDDNNTAWETTGRSFVNKPDGGNGKITRRTK